MKRREFIRLLALASIIPPDINKLLWVPGKKTIFIPSGISYADILDIELKRILPKIKDMFERDATFYNMKNKMR